MGDNLYTATSIFFIFQIMIGPCINFMPAAFNMSGYYFSFVLLSLVSILTAGSIYYSLKNKRTIEEDELPLTDSVITRKQEVNDNLTVDLITAGCSFVSAFAFQKYFIYLVNILILDFWPHLSHTMVNYAVLLASFVCFFAVGLVQNFEVLKGFILVNGYFMVSSLIVVLVYLNLYVPKPIAELPTNLNSKTDYMFSFTLFLVSFFVQTKIPSIYPPLVVQSKTRTIVISILSALGGFLVHGLVGYLGYRLLGTSIGVGDLMHVFLESNSTLNKNLVESYSLQEKNYTFLRAITEYQGLCGIMATLLGFPFTIAPIIRFCKERLSFKDTKSVMKQAMIITPLIFGTTLLNAIPNVPLNTIFGFLGPIFVNLISFSIPVVLYLLNAKKKSTFQRLLSAIILILSLMYLVYGCLDAVENFIYLHKDIKGFQVNKNVRDQELME